MLGFCLTILGSVVISALLVFGWNYCCDKRRKYVSSKFFEHFDALPVNPFLKTTYLEDSAINMLGYQSFDLFSSDSLHFFDTNLKKEIKWGEDIVDEINKMPEKRLLWLVCKLRKSGIRCRCCSLGNSYSLSFKKTIQSYPIPYNFNNSGYETETPYEEPDFIKELFDIWKCSDDFDVVFYGEYHFQFNSLEEIDKFIDVLVLLFGDKIDLEGV